MKGQCLSVGQNHFLVHSFQITNRSSFPVTQQPTRVQTASLLRFLDYTQLDTDIHFTGLLRTSDQPVSEGGTCTTHNKHNRRKSILSAGFENSIPAIERLQTYALNCITTGTAQKFQRLATRWTVRSSNPGGQKFSPPFQTDPGAQPSSCKMGIVCLFREQSGRRVALTTHRDLGRRLKKEQSCASFSLLGLHSLLQGKTYL